MLRYFVEGMRILTPTVKVAAKNPTLAFTVTGRKWHSVTLDEKGVPVVGDALTIQSKPIDREIAISPEFSVSKETGILTLPSGERGRKASAGITQDGVDALLESLREQAANADAEPEGDAEGDTDAESDTESDADTDTEGDSAE